ncbi:MAG: CoA-binding protein [Defluviimonas sp.]|nr:CoA-binding protein [Defluviimonas sp.]
MTTTDSFLRDTLQSTRVIAVVGFSPDPARPSHSVARYLRQMGYRVIPVNPGQAGKTLLGETVVARLSDIPTDVPVDMVDIFRRSDAVPEVVDEAMAALPHLRTIWMQLGVAHAGAAEKARAAGLAVVEDRCPRIEIPRLFGGASPLEGVPQV